MSLASQHLSRNRERKPAEEDVRKARDELEERVEERAGDLSAANAQLLEEITERKRADHALRRSEARYRTLFKSAPIAIREEDFSKVKAHIDALNIDRSKDFVAFLDRHPEFVAECAELIVEVDANEESLKLHNIGDKTKFLASFTSSFSDQALRTLKDVLVAVHNGETILEFETFVVRADGSRRDVAARWSVTPGHEDTYSQILFTSVDVTERKRAEEVLRNARDELELRVNERTRELRTVNAQLLQDIAERKQAEEALRESEARLAQAQRIAKIGHWVWDEKEDRESYCSGEGERIFGTPHESLSSNFEEFLAMVHADDRERVGALMKKARKDRMGYAVEYKIVRPDGETRFINELAEVEFDDGGELVRSVGTVQDISERKQAEEALRESEARLNRAQQIAGIGSFEWDATNNSVIYRSAIICDIYGVTPEKAPRTFDNTAEFMHPDDRERVRAEFTAATAAGEGYDVEYRIVRPDGEIRYIHELSRPVFDETGAIIRSVGTFQDITHRKRSEEALRESEERLKAFVDHAPAQVFLKDTDGRYLLVNREFVRHYGVTAEKAKGKTAYDLFPTDVADNLSAHDREVVETRRAMEREQLVPYADGWHTLLAVKFPILDTAGAVTGIGGIATDITERKQTQAQLIQASKLATLGEMATGLAHELNQPLNVIRMAADNVIERIADGELDAQYLIGKLERISAQTGRAAAIIDHMQIFGRKADGRPVQVDPREVIKHALGLVGEQFRLLGIEVGTVFPDHCRKVLGHSVQLEQVLVDIMSNARDAIESNRGSPGDPREISLIVEDTGPHDKIRLAVKDSGGGIPENLISRIYEPFFTTKEVGKGTGLGLSIAYGIVSDMGGTIEAANADHGAVITVTLPAAAARRKIA